MELLLRRSWASPLSALLALALLPAAALAGNCGAPPPVKFAQLQEEFQNQAEFPVGTTVKYDCRAGYRRIPGQSNGITCKSDSTWSSATDFCDAKSCGNPGDLQHGTVNIPGLTFGTEITFSCDEGYRLVGSKSSRCVIGTDQMLVWDRELPLCEEIPCLPPAEIDNGRHTGEPNAHYTYGSSVTYSCNTVQGGDPFSLIGEASIHCTSDPDKNGVWSGDPPECTVVKCHNAEIENGRKRSGFGPSYTYRSTIVFECNSGYELVGSSAVICQANNSWAPPIPTCKRAPAPRTCEKPVFPNGEVAPSKPQYLPGDVVNLTCKTNYAFSNNARSMTVVCNGDNLWSPPVATCHDLGKPGGTELSIKNGKIISGIKDSYSFGDFVTFECDPGYTMHGIAKIQYVGKNKWEPGIPECRLSTYIIVIIIMVILIGALALGVWLFKRHRSREGKRSSTPSTTEYSMCKT